MQKYQQKLTEVDYTITTTVIATTGKGEYQHLTSTKYISSKFPIHLNILYNL